MTNQQICEQAAALKEYVIECRRTIHRFAEISGTEDKTSAFIQSQIEETGLPYEKLPGHSLIATLDTGKPGPHIVLRADMDALPVPEQPNNLAGPRVCVSEDPHTCHACGHDAHTAMLLGSMKAMTKLKDELSGVIYFCYEEGEENGRGVPHIMEALSNRQVDTCWAIHVYAALESGKICVAPGARMAGAAETGLTVIGKGGHGSRPDLSINPVFCAASILTNVATAWVNQITAGETVTLGVTGIHGGEAGNIIPDTASMIGSMRFFNIEEGEKAVSIFKNVAEHTAAMNKCKVEFSPNFKIVCMPVINDAHCSEIAETGLREILGKDAVVRIAPWYASEAYSRYSIKYPSIFAHLGIKNPEYGSGAEHHNGYFDVDENVLPIGMTATMKYVAAFGEAYKH